MVLDLDPDFLAVRPGDLVVVEVDRTMAACEFADWWIGQVIHVVGGARSSRVNSLFQVVCVDTGLVRTINADLVKRILRSKDLS